MCYPCCIHDCFPECDGRGIPIEDFLFNGDVFVEIPKNVPQCISEYIYEFYIYDILKRMKRNGWIIIDDADNSILLAKNDYIIRLINELESYKIYDLPFVDVYIDVEESDDYEVN